MISLADARAAHAARRSYQAAAERHAQHALSEQDRGNRNTARYLARLALLLQKVAASEYEVVQR